MAASVLAACSDGGEGAPPVVEVRARWDVSAARDLTSLIEATGTVFVGEVTAKLSQTDSAQAQLPAGGASTGKVASHGPPGFPISHFAVHVLEPFEGGLETSDTLVIQQAGGEVEDASGVLVTAVLEGDELLEPGTNYLFFALLKDNGTYSAPPFARFEIGDDGRLIAPVKWAALGALSSLDGEATGAALREVQRAAH